MDDLERIEQQIKEMQQTVIEAETQQVPAPVNIVAPTNQPSVFQQVVEDAKVKVIQEAAANDEKFVKEVSDKLKEAAKKASQYEEEIQKYKKQQVEYEQELLDTQQKLNQATQQKNEWERKEKRREYHYNGVKPIMEFVGVKTPMNLVFLYFLTLIIIWFFLGHKLLKATFGALLAGAEDGNRSKAVRGFLWTLLAVIVTVVVVCAATVLLQRFAII